MSRSCSGHALEKNIEHVFIGITSWLWIRWTLILGRRKIGGRTPEGIIAAHTGDEAGPVCQGNRGCIFQGIGGDVAAGKTRVRAVEGVIDFADLTAHRDLDRSGVSEERRRPF